MRRRMRRDHLRAQHDVAVQLLAAQIEEAVAEPHLLGVSASPLTGNGSGSALDSTSSSAIASSTSPVGSLGLTVSGVRATTAPVTRHDALEPQRVRPRRRAALATSITHWVMP